MQTMSQLTSGKICVKMKGILVKMDNFWETLYTCQMSRLWQILQDPAQHQSWRHTITSRLVPPVSSVLRALSPHPDTLLTFPGMIKNLINAHLPPATATYKGHMVRKQINQNSTRSNRQAILDTRLQVDNMPPTEQIYNTTGDESMFCFLIVRDIHGNTVYSNLTRRFPIQSYVGVNYIFVCYVYKLNIILLQTMKRRKTKDMLQAFDSIYDELEEKGHRPTLHVLDNECSRAVKKFLRKKDTDIQIVEAHNHAVLAAEPTVNSATYHTIAYLATINLNCPIQLWRNFVPQIEITLNILQTSRVDTKKLACEALNGIQFDRNRTPLTLVGSRALRFLPSSARNTFQAHVIDTWYVGPSMLHYREMYFNNPTAGYCTSSGTYTLLLAHAHMPTISKDNHTIMVATDLLEMFKKIVPFNAIEKKKPLQSVKFTHQRSYQAPNTTAKHVDARTNRRRTTLEGGSSIKFEGEYNTNFEGRRDANHIC